MDKGIIQPLVSVCVPAFNAENFIRHTLESILDSSYANFEIIISDDCSDDHTREVLAKIKDNRIQLFSNPERMGVPANWNRAIKQASGEIICFLNHDDLIGSHWIEYAVEKLLKHPTVSWVSSNFLIVDAKGEVLQYVRKFTENRVYEPLEIFPVLVRQNGLGPGFVVRKAVMDEIGGFDETMGPSADNELFIRLAAGYQMFFSTTPHTSRRSHPGNLSHKWTRGEQTRDGLRILRKTFFESNLPSELLQCKSDAYLYFYAKIFMILDSLRRNNQLDVISEILEIVETEGIDFHEFNP